MSHLNMHSSAEAPADTTETNTGRNIPLRSLFSGDRSKRENITSPNPTRMQNRPISAAPYISLPIGEATGSIYGESTDQIKLPRSVTPIPTDGPPSSRKISDESSAPNTALLSAPSKQGSEGGPVSTHPLVVRVINWWWWWEIGSALLSITSICLIIAILARVSDKSLESWSLWIQPNSLISVLTTIGKTALMVPVTSCLAQLKFGYFSQKRSLDKLQLFDDASRGPWGALMMLFGVRFSALLSSTLALVTILALAIEPSAQQILDFPTRRSILSNVTAQVGRADVWNSKAFLAANRSEALRLYSPPTRDTLKLQASLIDGTTGNVLQPTLDCPSPATDCTWGNFTTLGVCYNSIDVTKQIQTDCSCKFVGGNWTHDCFGVTRDGVPQYPTQLACDYSFPDMVNDTSLLMNYVLNLDGSQEEHFSSMLFRSTPGSARSGASHEIGHLTTIKRTQELEWHIKSIPPVEGSFTTWYWCAQTFENVSATQSGLLGADTMKMTSERLSFHSRHETKEPGNKLGRDYFSFSANSTGRLYNISIEPSERMYKALIWKRMNTTVLNAKHDLSRPLDDFDIGGFLYMSNMSDVARDFAATLTNNIRSAAPGDNVNATTVLGTAYFKETYMQVRWAWLIIPLVEAVLGAVLLVVCILFTRKEPLLKTSLIALLVHRLDRVTEDEMDVMQRMETAEKLEGAAEKLLVEFKRNEKGELKFIRE